MAMAMAAAVRSGGVNVQMFISCFSKTNCLPSPFLSSFPSSSPFPSYSRSFSLIRTPEISPTPPRGGRKNGFRLPRSFCTAASDATPSPSPSPAPAPAPAQAAVKEEDGEDEGEKIRDAANMLDIRVGRILRAWRHEEADSLYVEEVDVGEPEPRIICSGLVNFIPLDQLQDIKVVVLANLKPRNMRGVKSCGMLMAASDASHENVELLVPPEGSVTGERIWFGSEDEKEDQPPAATPNQIQKKKIWETVQPHLKTNASCVAMLGVDLMQTSAGVVVCSSLKNANIS